jgi:DNA-binding MarR family transcriptional regulator
MDFFSKTGVMAIGSRLRMLSEKVTEDASKLYRLYDVGLHPKWFPVFHTLSEGDRTITAIAQEIGHSHPSVSKIVAEMIRKGIVVEKKDRTDKRRTMVGLTPKGKDLREKIKVQYDDVTSTITDLLGETRHNLWKAIEEWEYLLEQKSLFRRVQEKRKARESDAVKIVPYKPKYKKAFKELNEEWIRKYFEIEETDSKMLNDPSGQILRKGGHIFVALYNDEAVGVCAIIKMNDPTYEYELVKMAVRPDMQGKNIGWLLGQAAIAKARAVKAKYLYLESNTILEPAIKLYQKMGFKKVVGHSTPYKRCNIQMALYLKANDVSK